MSAAGISRLVTALAFMLLPGIAWAQAALGGGIAGVVRDATGAVLPGVTVEASSPALIEKVRTVVTDSQGQYKIVDLRPGTYSVTFTLAGFSQVRREGIELATGFTAAVNAELSVGLLAETITVSGAGPVVDVQNTQPQVVLQRTVLDALPVAKSFASYQALIPGVSGGGYPVQRDVGGTSGEAPLGQTVHGSDGGLTSLDGIMIISLRSPFNRTLSINHGYIEEVVVKMGSGSAETWSAGVHINIVPKSGGNTTQGNLFGDFSGKGLDSSNLTDDLRARGLNAYNKQRSLYDVGGGIGGKIKQDKAWFFWSSRYWGNSSEVAGNYFNATPHTLFYTPDLSRPAIFSSKQWDNTGRLTWQATRKDKFVFQGNGGSRCWCPGDSLSGLYSPEGTWIFWYGPERLLQAGWTRPATSRILLEGGVAWRQDTNRTLPTEGVLPTDRSVLETSINRRYGSNFQGALSQAQTVLDYYIAPSNQWMTRGAASFITGSHALKVGFSTLTGFVTTGAEPNFPENYIFRNQVPIALTLFASPHRLETEMNMILGLYAQDQWTVRRMTINAGLRFDYINASSPAQTRPGGEYLPALTFPEVNDLPNWKDLQPRVGLAYDLFGNARTALKLSAGRYALGNNFGLGFARLNSPAGRLVVSTDRTWTDTNRDYVPDCDLKSPLGNGECGPMANQNFGTSRGATLYADELKSGWGVSPYMWQVQAAVQHELLANVALNAGYYRTWQGNISLTDNLSVTAADFTPYCLTAPADPRLPGGGGYPVCGLYDVSPGRFGQVQNLVTLAADRSNVFDGFDAGLSARFGNGGILRAGIASGQTVIDNCATPDVPGQFCRRTVPFRAQTDLKLSGSYPLPWWQLQVSAVYQNLPGVPRTASYVAANAEIAPSLGRNLAACPNAIGPCNATAVVDLVEPNTLFEPRGNQLDLRVSKIVRFGTSRVQANVDVYNATNESDILSLNNRYGPQWWNAIGILAGRVWKFSAQFDF